MNPQLQPHKFQLMGRRSITIKVSEFVMLKHFLAHGIIKSNMVHDLYRHFAHRTVSSSVISNRLSKMLEAEILGRIEVPYTYNEKVLYQYFYFVKERALTHLHSFNRISDDEFRRGMDIQVNPQLPNPKSQTMSQMVHDLFLAVEEVDEMDLFYTHSEVHPIFQKDYRYKAPLRKLELWPEWILETDLMVVCLISVNSKLYNHWGLVFQTDFVKIVEEVKQQGKEFILFFSVYDGSDKEIVLRQDKAVYKSLIDMLEKLPAPRTWFPHFDVYVLPLNQTVQKLNALFHFENLIGKSPDSIHSLQHVFKHLNYSKLRYDFLGEQQEDDKVVIHERHQFEIDGEKRLIWMYYANTGSAEAFFHIRQLNDYFSHQKRLKLQEGVEKPDELWIIYETEEKAKKEGIFLKNSSDVWLTSLEAWCEISLHNYRFPAMYRMADWSYYRRRRTMYLKEEMEWKEDFSHLYMPAVDWKDDFFFEEEFLSTLRNQLNQKSNEGLRWIWRPRIQENALLADALGEIRLGNHRQLIFIIQECSVEDVIEHTLELMRNWSINPKRFDFLGVDSGSTTKEPLLVLRLENSIKVNELLNRISFYSSTMPLLIDAPTELHFDPIGNPTIPFLYWSQGGKIEKWKKEQLADLILYKMAVNEKSK